MPTTDKARYYLEQSVPQLQELLRKEIFNQQEIKSITKKRSDFEHTINARGHHATDYASYASYETNLASLIAKRTKRLKVKLQHGSNEASRRIFFILERGVRKFPGDLPLWMQLLSYARKEKARKKLRKLLTDVLRLHPTKSQLWIYAASVMVEDEADMSAARSYMQRGLRFCKSERGLWVEYARLECLYIGKIAARRKILGLDADREKRARREDDGEDMLVLPEVTQEDINPGIGGVDTEIDEAAIRNLENTPALSGAIPIAIFDKAMKQFENDPTLGEAFFDMVAEFETGKTFDKILAHIVATLEGEQPHHPSTIICQFMLPIVGIDVRSVDFAERFQESLMIIRTSMTSLPLLQKEIAAKAIERLAPLATKKEIDEDILAAINGSIRRYIKLVGSSENQLPIVHNLQERKEKEAARTVLETAKSVLASDVQVTGLDSGPVVPKDVMMVEAAH